MVSQSARRRVVGFAMIVTGLVLSGCSSAANPTGSGMMQGGSASSADPTGSRMMGDASGYHYSRLSCTPPNRLPGPTVSVRLADMGLTRMMGGNAALGPRMMLRATPATEPAGQISLVASNMGWRTHELVILQLAPGTAAGQRVPGADGKVDETGSLGEASNNCAAGTGDGVPAGKVGWTTVTLPPGRYELVCNLKNHYANGMYQEFVVT